ncbi:MAG TPA: uroporphyrinogen-III C-methyltransferase, partial [Balneolales bacterium]|nr:uroporphyrinogen-III C-methyltransferase [Balneolales bacterium]
MNVVPINIRKKGKVYLIGAGPGDPDLITLRGIKHIRDADVILYDRLIAPELLEEARPSAEIIYVGKEGGKPSTPQEIINQILVVRANEGHKVVRLKGGDPFVFGRGGEELEVLNASGISYEVVPGISSSIAAASFAGIPLTHRDHSSSFTVITGHSINK